MNRQFRTFWVCFLVLVCIFRAARQAAQGDPSQSLCLLILHSCHEGYSWTDAASKRPPLAEAVCCYRNKYRIKRLFNRLKSRLNIALLYVQQDDQVKENDHA